MNPTESLMAEHQVILRALACLEAIASDPEAAAHPELGDLLAFFREYADRCHHGKEEDCLFPAMEARGLSTLRGPTAVMRDEHEYGRELVGRMLRAREAEDVAALRGAAENYLDFLRAHIGKEDGVLFPLAERMLGGDGLAALGEQFDEVERESFGSAFHERHENWVRVLARELGVDRERYDVAPACGGM